MDGHSTVKRSALGTIVCQLTVIDLSLKTILGNTLVNEFFLNGSNTAFAQAGVDYVVTRVVVGPTGKHVIAVLVLHYLGNSLNNVALNTQHIGAVDGEVDSCQST